MQTTDTIQNSTVQPSSRAARGLGLVLAGGLIAGALDLTFAFVFYGQQGAAPLRILQGIASGVLGRGSFQMGLASAALGAFFHFFISVCAAAIYYLVSLRFSFLTRRVAISGAIFGVLMFLAMHFIVVPLSAIKPSPMKVGNVIGELCSHVFLFGMVIAYAVSRVKSLRTGQ
jgi:uncharacterized membrane protein YagU involved in acid resistance